MKSSALLLFVGLLHQHRLCASIHRSMARQRLIEPQPQSEVAVPSRIIINYVSKYFRKSDMFVKIQLSSINTDQNRIQLELIETVMRHEKLSDFTFVLDNSNVDDEVEHRLAREGLKTVQRKPFNLFVIDSLESFR